MPRTLNSGEVAELIQEMDCSHVSYKLTLFRRKFIAILDGLIGEYLVYIRCSTQDI